jgi:hypothetical protein
VDIKIYLGKQVAEAREFTSMRRSTSERLGVDQKRLDRRWVVQKYMI